MLFNGNAPMDRETLVKECLSSFLDKHGLNNGIEAVDEIVLSYVISILEDLGDDQNAEENIDVDQFTEMMDAYIPGFSSIDSVEVCEWMFLLSSQLTNRNAVTDDNYTPDHTSQIGDILGATAAPPVQQTEVNGNGDCGDAEALEDDEQVRALLEMFPETCTMEVSHCLSLSNGDLDEAAQLIIHREEKGDSIINHTTTKKKKEMVLDDYKVKSHIINRFSYVDTDSDKKTYAPVVKKQDSKKMVRYLDNKVVSTKGERFTEIKREDSEEMKKTYINLKPARKYRFH